MADSAAKLAGVPLKTMKARLPIAGPDLSRIESAGRLVQQALIRSGISQKDAAIQMGVNDGQFARQLAGQEHLSWQRLNRLSDRFFLELLIVLAEDRGIAAVKTLIEIDRKFKDEKSG